MKYQLKLTITSLLSILFFSCHWADEVARGIERGGLSAFWGLLILAIWLYGTLVLADRRSGLVIILLASLLAAGVPVLHMQGAGLVGGKIANSSGIFFWVWTLIGLGVTGIFSFMLSASSLWSLWRSPAARDSRP
jgi:hypothetical protein